MRVEIYGDAKRKTVSGPTVQFTADDAAPVNDLKAQITPSIAGYSAVTIAANGQNTNVSLTKSVYGGSSDITTGVVTETHGGGAYNPTAVPSDLSSKIVSATTARSASGSVASFNCSLGEYPMSALTAAINPVQDLHGYDHPWPGGGGANRFFVNESAASSNCIDSASEATGVVSVADVSTAKWSTPYIGYSDVIAGKTYTISGGPLKYGRIGGSTGASGQPTGSTTPDVDIGRTIQGAITNTTASRTFKANASQRIYWFYCTDSGIANHQAFDVRPVVVEGSNAGTWSPYSNICPITGWTGATIHVSPSTTGGTTYPVTFPTAAGTVYGGTLDVVNGVLTVGWKIVDLASLTWSATSWGGWRSNIIPELKEIPAADNANLVAEKYKSVSRSNLQTSPNSISTGLASSPKQLFVNATDSPTGSCVYPLATPVEYTLTPQDIATILGQNNVWADTGDVTVSYRDGLLSNVSGIMTNSTALTTGENITYTLSQERTFQIPGTVIRTVVGNNVMSASTGNISVTWSSHWFDITPWIAYQGLTFSRNDVDSPDAGRDMSGYMHRGRVGVKEKMNVTTVQLTRAQSSTLQTLLYPETIQVRVTPYPRTNTSHTMSMYTNNVKTTYVIHRKNGEDLQSLTFPLIEN